MKICYMVALLSNKLFVSSLNNALILFDHDQIYKNARVVRHPKAWLDILRVWPKSLLTFVGLCAS